jgi:iron-regulated transporter 1
VVLALWHLPRGMVPPSLLTFHPTFTTKFSLFFFLCLSRLGLWTFDLTAQQLAQTRITPDGRSSFAGVETSLVGVFELGHWMAALIAGGHAERFRWLALGSLGAVGASMSMYMFWLRRERGHLVHWPPYGKREWVRMVSVS